MVVSIEEEGLVVLCIPTSICGTLSQATVPVFRTVPDIVHQETTSCSCIARNVSDFSSTERSSSPSAWKDPQLWDSNVLWWTAPQELQFSNIVSIPLALHFPEHDCISIPTVFLVSRSACLVRGLVLCSLLCTCCLPNRGSLLRALVEDVTHPSNRHSGDSSPVFHVLRDGW